MLSTLMKSKKHLLLAMFLLLLGACKQSEFYDKAALLESEKEPTSTEAGTGSGSGSGSDSGTTTTSDNGTGGDSVTPEVILTPPPVVVVLPPVPEEPPVVITPPPVVVVVPPVIIEPPVVIDPPPVVVVTPPEVIEVPVVTPPVVVPEILLEDRNELFTQDSSKDGDVDILWVVDNSGSMADNQEALADNFNNFINQFLEKDIDFKMAITTTDATSIHNGKMVGDSSQLTSASAIGNRTAFTNNFTKWIKVGTSGSGIEQGLKTASSFLDRYLSSYVRKDAYLAIVFVSDEEDQSSKAVSEYIARYQSAKANKGMVKAYSIVTQTNQPDAKWETLGLRYNEVAMATGGKVADINEDFASSLKDIGGSIVNLIDSFSLAETPYDNTIQVFVNSIQVSTGWNFDVATHSLKFNADSIPAEGAAIEVRYKVKATVIGAI